MGVPTAISVGVRPRTICIGRTSTVPRFSHLKPTFKVIERRGPKQQHSRHSLNPKPIVGRPWHSWGDKPGCGAGRQAVIMWFRNDLRLDDNEALGHANKEGTSVLPVYCFDPRDYGKSAAGVDKMGAYRATFLLDSVADLRERLQQLGSRLILKVGKPEQVLAELAERVSAKAVVCQAEVTQGEVAVEAAVKEAVETKGAIFSSIWCSTLHHLDDLPFELSKMPSSYGDFRDAMRGAKIRPPLDPPSHLKGLPAGCNISDGKLPTLQQLGVSDTSISNRATDKHSAAAGMKGGETEARRQLSSLVAEVASAQGAGAAANKMTRGRPNSSCKVSPWLAMGALSPRRMYLELNRQWEQGAPQQQATKKSGKTESRQNRMSWLHFELLWRDFFRFITKKYSANPSTDPSTPQTLASAPSMGVGHNTVLQPALAAA